MSEKYTAVRISGVALDSSGYRYSPGIYEFDLFIASNGQIFDEWHGKPFFEINFDGEGFSYGAGSFIPDDGEIERLKKLGAKISATNQAS